MRERLFIFALCERLKVRHPNYLLPELYWDELTDWIAYFEIKDGDEDPTSTLAPKIDVPATLALIKRLKESRATAV